MADLSKIKLNGIEYNLKDTEARQLVSDLEDSIPEVPSALSELDNDVGYITSYTETDPTVPAWAKAENKPTYTAAEIGATTTEDVNTIVASALENALDVFITNVATGYSSGDNEYWYTSTKSLTQIINAYNNNKICYAIYSNNIYYLATAQTNNVIFAHYSGNDYLDILKLTTSNTSNKDFHQKISLVENLKTQSGLNNTEYNLIGTTTSNTNTSAVKIYNPGSISFAKTTNEGRLTIGNSSLPGKIRLYSNVTNATGYTDLISGATSTNTKTITFPDANGTVALITDIPSVPSWAMQSSKPSYAFSELTSHPTTLNDYGITDAYTKTEVDGLVSGVLHYKGTKATVSALPSSGNVTGDVWHITADGSEWAWDGSDWQELGTAIDLTGYLQSSDIAAWAKASTKPSYTASEVGALASNTTYVSTFNGQSGAITYIAPVTSVNGQTGAVTLSIPTTASDISAASATHAHGNITSGGDMTATAAIASGDRLVINDESASKLVSSTITFGSSTAQYLANNGTWQNAYDDTALAARVTALEQIPWVTYYTGSSAPSNSQGNNGDLYFQTAQ